MDNIFSVHLYRLLETVRITEYNVRIFGNNQFPIRHYREE